MNQELDVEKRYDNLSVFYIRERPQLLELLSSGQITLNVEQIMRRILECKNCERHPARTTRYGYAYTDDAFILHPDANRFKIDLNSSLFKRMIKDGVHDFRLSIQEYEQLRLPEYSKIEMEVDGFNFSGCDGHHARNNPLWLALARGNRKLLSEYVDLVLENKSAHSDTMPVSFSPTCTGMAELGIFGISPLSSGSRLLGNVVSDFYYETPIK